MGVRAALARLFSTGTTTVVVECRHCGENVGADTETCPGCGSAEIACYRIPS